MGCTSSAQNMTPSQTNTDNNIKLSEDIVRKSMDEVDEILHPEKNETNEINVLPTCDTLGEPTQLDSNKSFIGTSSPDREREIHANGHVMENENSNTGTSNILEITENLQVDEKLSTLEEVVEKVVELYVSDSGLENSQIDHNGTKENKEKKDNTYEDHNVNDTHEIQNIANVKESELKEADPEQMASPSQSESSRATRWEALADIAAELPPSLAVDPLTGQIYSLSK